MHAAQFPSLAQPWVKPNKPTREFTATVLDLLQVLTELPILLFAFQNLEVVAFWYFVRGFWLSSVGEMGYHGLTVYLGPLWKLAHSKSWRLNSVWKL